MENTAVTRFQDRDPRPSIGQREVVWPRQSEVMEPSWLQKEMKTRALLIASQTAQPQEETSARHRGCQVMVSV